MSDDLVLTSREGAVGVMRFNRPRTLNALDLPMLLAMEGALDALAQDDSVRAIVIGSTSERAFMAGGDIKDLNTRRGLAHHEGFGEVLRRVFRRFETCAKPTLTAVNGWALGGGMELLLCSDIRLMAEDAQMGLPELKIGLFPGGGGSQRLMRQVSPCQAKLLMFTGDPITAAQALTLGLVNRVVPRDRLMVETMTLAHRIAAQAPLALKLLKRSMLQGSEMMLSAALEHEQALISLVFDSDDAHEGCSAFIEKREAHFTGK